MRVAIECVVWTVYRQNARCNRPYC